MKHLLVTTSLLLASAIATANPTNATAIAIRNVNLAVFDRTPADGLAAGYTLSNSAIYLTISVSGGSGVSTVDGHAGDTPTRASTIELEYKGSHASSGWDGATGGLSVSVASNNPMLRSSAHAEQSMLVKLAPHTVFVFSAVADHDMPGLELPPGSPFLTSRVGARLKDLADPARVISFERRLGGPDAPEHDFSDPFSLTYVNDTDLSRTLSFELFTSATAAVPSVAGLVSAVPEPSAYLMLGAGLLGVGSVARRRQRG